MTHTQLRRRAAPIHSRVLFYHISWDWHATRCLLSETLLVARHRLTSTLRLSERLMFSLTQFWLVNEIAKLGSRQARVSTESPESLRGEIQPSHLPGIC